MVRYELPADNAESEGEFGHGLALLFAGFCLELNFLFQQRRCCNSNTYLHLKVVAVVKKQHHCLLHVDGHGTVC